MLVNFNTVQPSTDLGMTFAFLCKVKLKNNKVAKWNIHQSVLTNRGNLNVSYRCLSGSVYTGYRKHLHHHDNALTAFETNWCKSIKLWIESKTSFLAPVSTHLSAHPTFAVIVSWERPDRNGAAIHSEGQRVKVKVAVSMNIQHPHFSIRSFFTFALNLERSFTNLLVVLTLGCRWLSAHHVTRFTFVASLITCFLGFCGWGHLVSGRSSRSILERLSHQIKRESWPGQLVLITGLCKEQGKRRLIVWWVNQPWLRGQDDQIIQRRQSH